MVPAPVKTVVVVRGGGAASETILLGDICNDVILFAACCCPCQLSFYLPLLRLSSLVPARKLAGVWESRGCGTNEARP